jgi:hypothetical protein
MFEEMRGIMMGKRTYYVSLTQGEISQIPTAESMFIVTATTEEIHYLRKLFEDMYTSDWASYWRAQVPFLEYHHDEENDEYDQALQTAYAYMYKLGNDETKQHIKGMGILESK